MASFLGGGCSVKIRVVSESAKLDQPRADPANAAATCSRPSGRIKIACLGHGALRKQVDAGNYLHRFKNHGRTTLVQQLVGQLHSQEILQFLGR
jgi:hypothetical protein